MRRTWFIALLVVILGASLATLAQQPTTGTLAGSVVDNEGKALPGATITIDGPTGTRAATTNADGMFEFRFVLPGRYKLSIEMSGFAPIQLTAVDVTSGERTFMPVKLFAGGSEEVTVTSATPLVDVKKVEVSTSFKTDTAIQTLPVGRNFVAAVAFAPGVVSGGGTGGGNYSISGSSGLENSYIIDGVNITDGGYGGVGSYSIVYGSLGTGITTDFLEEVAVKTAGFEAEYGQALGGVVSGVVRAGSNDFKGRIGAYYSPASLEAQGKDVVLPGGTTNIHEREVQDFGLQAGGPIIKDKLFWFAAYNPVKSSYEVFPSTDDPTNPVYLADDITQQWYTNELYYPGVFADGVENERTRDNYAAKINWVMTPNHRFELTVFGDPSDGTGATGSTASTAVNLNGDLNGDGTYAADEYITPAYFGTGGAACEIDYGADQQSLKYNGFFGSDWFVEGQISNRKNEFKDISTATEHRYRDRRPYLLTNILVQPLVGGSGFVGPTTDESLDYALKVTKAFGNHELKFGGQYFDLKYTQIARYSGPSFNVPFAEGEYDAEAEEWVATGGNVIIPTLSGGLVDVRGGYGVGNCDPTNDIYVGNCESNPYYRVTRARFNEPGETLAYEMSFFIQDTWSISDKWTLKLGVRSTTQELEGAEAFSLPFTQVSSTLFTTDVSTYAPNKYKFATEWSPRLGVTFDPWANGKTKFFANYARYFERVPSDLAVRQFSNEVGISQFEFTDPLLQNRRGTGAPRIQGITPGTVADGSKLPYVDEYVVGWQNLLRPDLSVEIRGIFRKQGRVLEDTQFVTVEEIQNYYYGDPDYGYGVDPFPDFPDDRGFGAYVLSNPGENSGEGFGDPVRDYSAMELQLTKRLADNWQGFANYRYSRLRGNYEGLYRNDNTQSDPNITSLFDFPNSPLMRGQFDTGALNTDRPNVLNIGGTYFFKNGFETGGIITWQSGIPRTALLAHPNYQNAGEIPGQDPLYLEWNGVDGYNLGECTHEYACFLGDYADAPRGNLGRTPDYAVMDLHFGWGTNIKDTRLKINFDIQNLFNNQEPDAFDDDAEITAATPNPNFTKILSYQLPRAMRVSVIWDW